ncbi:MAG: hypothetical protein GY696_18015 [Gammaproteobacteria bacterium]|nr:hypothetical protein [Gammaproteobacteria bacterium]
MTFAEKRRPFIPGQLGFQPISAEMMIHTSGMYRFDACRPRADVTSFWRRAK